MWEPSVPEINGLGIDRPGIDRPGTQGTGRGAPPQHHDEAAYAPGSRVDDSAARFIAYLGPYLFWVTLGVLSSAIFLIA